MMRRMARLRPDITLLILLTAGGITLLAPTAWLVLAPDAMLVGLLILAAAGSGCWPLRWLLASGADAPKAGPLSRPAARFCLAVGLGLGLLAVLTLALGSLGWLSTATAWAMLTVGLALGVLWLRQRRPPTEAAPVGGRTDMLALAAMGVLAVPLAVALLGSTLPPGILWPEEAFGYDVLEYHLQAPREYFAAGRIIFLPHNVYASFPQQVEMLYLLLMHLLGDVYAAATACQLLHAALGILAALAVAACCETPRRRLLALVLAASTPWLAYLGCLAYVENGLLLFTALAGVVVIDHLRCGGALTMRRALLAGLMLGLATGCKYTAGPLVALPLVAAWVLTAKLSPGRRAMLAAACGLAALAALSPWLVRNTLQTGNPVYPFAYRLFDGRAWSQQQARQWDAAHRLPPGETGAGPRLRRALRELTGFVDRQAGTYRPSLFGPALVALGLLGVLRARTRLELTLIVWLAGMLGAWAGLTFIAGRFAIPAVVPLALLGAGQGGGAREDGLRNRFWSAALGWAVVLTALGSDLVLLGRYRQAAVGFERSHGVPLLAAVGQTDALVRYNPLNELLPPDAYAWLVGEARLFYVQRRVHYTVVFSRDPWLEYAAGHDAPAAVAWLAQRGVTHVVFCWPEIDRLRGTYGFSPLVTPRWVDALQAAGLEPVSLPGTAPAAGMYAVYRVPPISDRSQ